MAGKYRAPAFYGFGRGGERNSLRVLAIIIMPKIPDISVEIQMEGFVSVSSDRNTRDHLWRWSTSYRSIFQPKFDK